MVPKVVVFLAALALFGCEPPKYITLLTAIDAKLDVLTKQQAMQAPTGCFFLEAADAGQAPGLYVVQLMCPAGKPDVELAPVIKQAAARPPTPTPAPVVPKK